MIVSHETMKQIENHSNLSIDALMRKAGESVAEALKEYIKKEDRILIISGKGNNGGDGFVVYDCLKEYDCKVYLAEGKPKSEAAQNAFKAVKEEDIITAKDIEEAIRNADVIVDAIYGFGFHGNIQENLRKLFVLINESKAKKYSIDINSGAESDNDHHDKDAILSDVTFALDCFKPTHLFRKEHHLFKEVRLLPLGLNHDVKTNYHTMDEETFFANFPKRNESAHKTSSGRILLVGGCYGMAGALSLNILGAKTVGASYINAALPDDIYPIVSMQHMTTVFHPFSYHTMHQVVEPLVKSAKAIGFGSGIVNMPRKLDCLDVILQNSSVPVVLDAEALRLLHQNTYILKFVKAPIIITPHIGEFSSILNQPIEVIKDNKLHYATAFAKQYNVYVVLKGSATIVASPHGDIYINQSGNQALAQAGSGDLLTGILTAVLSLTTDTFKAITMAVWLHGYLADLGIQSHAIQNFSLETFPSLMDALYRKHNL